MNDAYNAWDILAERSWKKTAEHNWFHKYVLYPAICDRLKGQLIILDYGCGSGELIAKLQMLRHRAFGFDPSVEMVKRAREVNVGALIVNDLTSLKCKQIDLVVLNLVLSCVSDASSVIRSALNYAERMIITIPHPFFSLFSDLHTTTRRLWHGSIVPYDERELYFLEPQQKVIWDDEGTATLVFHRTLSTWFSLFKKFNLTINHIEELVPIQSGSCISRLYKQFSKIPSLMLFDLERKC